MLSERVVLLATRSVRSLALGALGIALPLALEANALGTARIAYVLSAGLGGATLLVVLGPGAKVRNRKGTFKHTPTKHDIGRMPRSRARFACWAGVCEMFKRSRRSVSLTHLIDTGVRFVKAADPRIVTFISRR